MKMLWDRKKYIAKLVDRLNKGGLTFTEAMDMIDECEVKINNLENTTEEDWYEDDNRAVR